MKTLQQYLDQKYEKNTRNEVRWIQVNEGAHEDEKNELKNIEGGKLDLTDYSDLEFIKIDGSYLKSPLTKLVLSNKPKLKELLCSNNNLTNIDISGCSELEEMDIDGDIFKIISEDKIDLRGWDKTKIIPQEHQARFAELVEGHKEENRLLNQIEAPNRQCKIL